MLQYIDAGVEDLRSSRSSDEVTLLLGVVEERDDVITRLEQFGAHVETTLGRATIRVTIPESAVDSLCELEGLKSIEIDRADVQTLDQGNGHSRQRVTR